MRRFIQKTGNKKSKTLIKKEGWKCLVVYSENIMKANMGDMEATAWTLCK